MHVQRGTDKMKISKRQLRRIIKEAIGQGGLDKLRASRSNLIIVDWDDDGDGLEPQVELHPDAIADYYAIAAEEGEHAADLAVTEMLTDDTGYLVNGWEWA